MPGHIVFKNLVAATLGPITDKRKREKLTDELQRIEAALQADLPALGRGVAFFTCPTGELWRQIALSLPLRDCAHVGSRPYIRPLARTRDEHDRFILVLLSLDRNRFFVSQIGQVEEVFEVRGERAVPKPEATRNEARVLARVAEPIRRPASAALGCARAARRIHQSPGRERTAQPAPGAHCGACKALLPAIVSECTYCHSAKVEAVEEVVELAIEAALQQKAALEMVRSGRARQLLAQRGPMAALFRW